MTHKWKIYLEDFTGESIPNFIRVKKCNIDEIGYLNVL